MTHYDTDFSDAAQQPLVFIRGAEAFASSRDVADYFEKRHDHVLRDVDALIAQEPALATGCAPNFGGTSGRRDGPVFEETRLDVDMPNGGRRLERVFIMNRDAFTLLAVGFRGEKALKFKLRYIAAFTRLEEQLRARAEGSASPSQDALPVDVEHWLGLVREARRTFGRGAARKLWSESPLPLPAPDVPLDGNDADVLIRQFIEARCEVTGSSRDFIRSRTLCNAAQEYFRDMGLHWPGDRAISTALRRLADTYIDQISGRTLWPIKRSHTGYGGIRLR